MLTRSVHLYLSRTVEGHRQILGHVRYASSLATTRKPVTVVNDDGRVAWNSLSVGEKAARTTQQTFNLALVIGGAVVTGIVGYALWTNVISTDSVTIQFNKAVAEVTKDSRVTKIFGPSSTITAHGEPSMSRWARNRFVASEHRTDGMGRDHVLMHFYIESPKAQGKVNVHLLKKDASSAFEYHSLVVEPRGQMSITIHSPSAAETGKTGFKFLGMKW